MNDLRAGLASLAPFAARLRRGVEKESLRVRADGSLAATPHPRGLGSALAHPHITTDFSEAQLELVTGVHDGVDGCIAELTALHRFVYRQIGDELLWCASMPCGLPEESAIPIAQYGTSNVARTKTTYRIGLSHRYGRRMQMISGVHYNFSLPDEALTPARSSPNEAYFALMRNFRRHAWLLLYLFGASPAICRSFVEGRRHELAELSRDTLYLPYATSLRMGRLGYLSAAQDALYVSYNDLESYGASLEDALTQPYPPYEAIGVRDGEAYRQLAATLLQVENEFYSTIRPKRVIRPGERPLHALRERGVQYVEVRAMDLDPFSPVGIAAATARFLDTFLLHCLLSESPPDSADESRVDSMNKLRVAARGREPGLRLERDGGEIELRQWAAELIDACVPIAAALDAANGIDGHAAALASAREAVNDAERVPSARMLREIRDVHGGSYVSFALAWSHRHREEGLRQPLSAPDAERLARMAEASFEEQRGIEEGDATPFEAFLQQYLSPASLRLP